MKNLVLFLFVLVAGVWVTEGQQSTEVPSVITEEEADGPPDNGALSNDAYSDGEYESVTEDPSVNNETVVDNDSGNSTTGESLTVWTPPRTCRVKCYKTVTYKQSRKAWCFLRRCTKYSLKYRKYSTTCLKCCKGWTGVPRKCRDINECRKKPCAWNARCINTPGSYRCVCDRGYTMGRRECVDVNECRQRPCGRNGRCVNKIGSYRCFCNRGYRWDGKTCTDINECRRRVCGRYARCYNTPGSYYCKCYGRGYQMIGKRCVDINECLKNPCPSDAKCYNYPGSYRCACKRGYRYLNKKCVDYNECKYKGRCDQICINTPGSYYCRCNKGYEIFKNRFCVDINECRCNNGGCPFPYRCINRPGHHYCDCPFGFGVKGNMCHLLIPQKNLNFTLPNNPTVIPRMKPQVHSTTLAPNKS